MGVTEAVQAAGHIRLQTGTVSGLCARGGWAILLCENKPPKAFSTKARDFRGQWDWGGRENGGRCFGVVCSKVPQANRAPIAHTQTHTHTRAVTKKQILVPRTRSHRMLGFFGKAS